MHAARDVADQAADLTKTALNLPRRFSFLRQSRQHPVHALDDPQPALAGMALAFIEMGATPDARRHGRAAARPAIASGRFAGRGAGADGGRPVAGGAMRPPRCRIQPPGAQAQPSRSEGDAALRAASQEGHAGRWADPGQEDELADLARRYRLA
ncbi:MAG: hypothetical protein JKP98_00450 [Rhodobacteraceae bacterium]|nr:hypothetical protein [Paracoccaceae bacterium]